MKRAWIVAATALLLTACGGNVEKKASEKLAEARTALERGDFNEAKIQLDSIKILYPKAYEARHAGNRLLLEVEKKEQEQSLVYLDSLQQVKQQEADAMKSKFTLEKDAGYQEVGNYFWPTQTVEKNLHRTYLRFQVSELGELTMTSIYCGSSNIHHTTVKVTEPGGTFAETPPSKDIYETTDLGEKIEKADFKIGSDGDVMGFLYLNRDKPIKVELKGDRTYNMVMPASDKQALAGVYELSQLLSAIQEIKKEKEEANLKIRFVNERMEKNAQEDSTKEK